MKDKTTAAVLAFVIGGIGGHRFYLGETGWGLFYLFFCWTFIPAIASFIEGILFLLMNEERFHAKYSTGPAWGASERNIVVNVSQSTDGGGHVALDLAGQLQKLHDLHLAGVLTEDEFLTQKQRLLTSPQ